MNIPQNLDPAIVAAIVAAGVALIIAAVSGLWSARVKSQENERARWRRIEELMQILHNGSSKGAWAQRLAVSELATLAPREKSIIPVLQAAQLFFEQTGANELAVHMKTKLDSIK